MGPTAAVSLVLAVLPQASGSAWRQYATPEEAGFSSEQLAETWELADGERSGAVFAVFRGHVLLAWGEIERRFECHSVRKSLVNALIGRAVDQGKLKLDATLDELGIDDLQPLTADEKRARVRDLLCSCSGVYHPAAKEPADMRAERPARGSHAPGEHFFYNNWDFNLLGTLFERAGGRELFAAFRDDLAVPLGMEDFRLEDGFEEHWPTCSRYPAHAFRLSARDLARFGQLYLQQGSWDGKALVPASWVRESTTSCTDFGDGRGYGRLWWTYAAGSLREYPALDRHDCFAAIGTGGQFLLVVPGAELVFVHRGDTDNEREVRGSKVWALAERVLAARIGEPAAEPELTELRVEPFTDPGPPLPERKPVALAPAVLEGLAGEYGFQGFSVRVFVHEGRLFVHRSDGEEGELFALSDSRFYLWFPAMEAVFERDSTGHATRVKLVTARGELAGERTEGPR